MNFKKYRPFVFLMSIAIILSACDKMEDGYMEFTKGGEKIYLGKADSVNTFSGKNRIKVSWLLISDPKINKSVIYWNEKADSAIVDVQRTEGVDTVSIMLNNMKEQTYNFEIYNYDGAGHSSIKEEAIGTVFGDNYASTITNRSFESTTYSPSSKTVDVNWYGAATEAVVVEILYTDVNGVQQTVKNYRTVVPTNPLNPTTFPAITTLPKYKRGLTFKYRTGYLPKENAIDTFYTAYTNVELVFPSTADINIVRDKSVERSSDASSGRATNIVDGDKTTFWQPLSSDRSDLNTWVIIDLEDSETFDHAGVYWTKANDRIASYDIMYSDDKVNWQVAFHKVGSVPLGELVSFPEVSGRYVKLSVDLSSVSNVTLGELEIFDK